MIACALLSACLGPSRGAAPPPDPDPVASAGGVALQIAPGVALASAGYAITGAGGFSRTGMFDVSNSASVSGVVPGLPAGTGYTVTLSGAAAGGGATCAGSATFDVAAGQTTPVTVHVLCHETPRTGSVFVGGVLNLCPVIDGVATGPGPAAVGVASSLSASGHDGDAGPQALVFHWSAASGSFGSPDAAATTFTCAAPGPVVVTVSATDGDPAAACADRLSLTLTCAPAGPAPTTRDAQAILSRNCLFCHRGVDPPRGLDWTNIRAQIGVPSVDCPTKNRITSGSAATSYLIDKVRGAPQDGGCFSGARMPLGLPPLTDAEIATLVAWIDVGTPP